MTTDLVLDAARLTLTALPDADSLLADLKAQLVVAEATQAQLRLDIREILTVYRAWRRAARCGRAIDNVTALHPTYLRQLRRVWATYRLTQLLLRDMRAMASLRARQLQGSQRVAIAAPVLKTPANEQADAFDADGIGYEELEAKYGPVLAQRLYDEICAQVQHDRTRVALKH